LLCAAGCAAAPSSAPAGAVDELNALPCPASFPIELDSFDASQIAAAKQGDFEVAGVPTHLEPPIDWGADPIGSSVYRRALTELIWLDPLIYAYAANHDLAAFLDAKAIVLDFVARHPRVDRSSADVWERKRAGDRLIRIVYLLRVGACEHMLSGHQSKLLLKAARQHARFLFAEPNTPLRTNHDLVQDLGLMAVGRYLPFLETAQQWYENGNRRFKSGIAQLVDPVTGVHLEHTASYQMLSVDRVQSYLDLAIDPAPGMQTLLGLMREVASWFVMPDGTLAPFGDTPFGLPAPPYALDDSDQDVGLSPTRRSGFAMVKQPGSYLGVTAGYHRPSHKQADELSFELFEDGHRVIVDSGRENPGRGPVGAKQFSLSSQAHSTLSVGARSFPLDGDFYGSALDAQGSGDGWFAIQGHNPLLAPQHVHHRRLFLYKPGVGLVIVERLQGSATHAYSRFFQIAPELHARRSGDLTRLLGAGGFKATIWHGVAPGATSSKLFYGQENPLRGWYAPPGISRLQPRYTLRLRTPTSSATFVETIGIGAAPLKARPSAHGADVKLPGGTEVALRTVRSGSHLSVTATPIGP
jgi:hypothetical protein